MIFISEPHSGVLFEQEENLLELIRHICTCQKEEKKRNSNFLYLYGASVESCWWWLCFSLSLTQIKAITSHFICGSFTKDYSNRTNILLIIVNPYKLLMSGQQHNVGMRVDFYGNNISYQPSVILRKNVVTTFRIIISMLVALRLSSPSLNRRMFQEVYCLSHSHSSWWGVKHLKILCSL